MSGSTLKDRHGGLEEEGEREGGRRSRSVQG